MVEYQRQVANVIRRNPNLDYLMTSVGGGFGGASGNTANVNVLLTPSDQRKDSVAQIVNKLRPGISRFPGFRAIPRIPPAINIGTRGSSAAYELTLTSSDTEELARQARRLQTAVERETRYV